MNVCGEIFDSKLIDTSCASRLGKGTYAALCYALNYHRRYKWCLKLDVRKYFDYIDHEVVKRQLLRMFKDRQLLNIFNEIIDSYSVVDNCGLPIGNLTSQYLANHYLSSLDHYGKERLKADGYVRYMDDILVYADNRAKIKELACGLRMYLANELNLDFKVVDIKPTTKSVQYLGYKIAKNGLLLSNRSKRRFKSKFKLYNRLLEYGIWDENDFKRHILPLISFVKKSNSDIFLKRCILNLAT